MRILSLSALGAVPALAFGLALSTAAPASAQSGAYAGIEAGLNTLDIASPYDKDFEDGLTAFGVYGGWRFGGNFAVEVGYTAGSEEEKKLDFGDPDGAPAATALNTLLTERYGPKDATSRADVAHSGSDKVTGSTEVQASAITVDGVVFIPVSRRIELIGSAGLASWTVEGMATVSQGNASTGYRVTKKIDEDEIGFRIGGGAQYKLADNITVRGMVRYNTMGVEVIENKDAFDSSLSATLGVSLSF